MVSNDITLFYDWSVYFKKIKWKANRSTELRHMLQLVKLGAPLMTLIKRQQT